MEKAAVQEVLDQTVGQYLENVDAESLSVALWQGSFAIDNVKVNLEAVNQQLVAQQSTYRLLKATVQSFSVEIPWRHLLSQPVVIHIQGVALEARAAPTVPPSAAQKRDMAMEQANQQRQAASDKTPSSSSLPESDETAPPPSKASSLSSSSSFATRLSRIVFENLQVRLESVHIGLVSGSPASGDEAIQQQLGLVLGEVSLTNPDESNNRPKTTTSSEQDANTAADTAGQQPSILDKILQVKGLGVYLDPDKNGKSQNSGSGGPTSEAATGLDDAGGDTTPAPPLATAAAAAAHDFLVQPFDMQARFRQAQQHEDLVGDDGKVDDDVHFQLDQLRFGVNSHQLDSIRQVMSTFQQVQGSVSDTTASASTDRPEEQEGRLLFPEYRPVEPICLDDSSSSHSSATIRSWWKYALRCVIALKLHDHQPLSPSSELEHHHHRGKREKASDFQRLSASLLWLQFFRAFRLRRRYVALYRKQQQQLQSKDAGFSFAHSPTLTKEEIKELHFIEQDPSISIEGLMLWRDLADEQLEPKEGMTGRLFHQQRRTKDYSGKSKSATGALHATAATSDVPKESVGVQGELAESDAVTSTEAKQDEAVPIEICRLQCVLGLLRLPHGGDTEAAARRVMAGQQQQEAGTSDRLDLKKRRPTEWTFSAERLRQFTKSMDSERMQQWAWTGLVFAAGFGAGLIWMGKRRSSRR